MKKLAILIFTALALASCTKYVPENDKSSTLDYFASCFHSVVLGDPVKNMIDLAGDPQYSIFADDFSATVKYNDGQLVIKKDPAADSTWTVEGSYSGYDYISSVTMGNRDAYGLYTWTCIGVGYYDEGNGYTANLANNGVSSFYWIRSAGSGSFTLTCDSVFQMETFKQNGTIESKKYSYDKSPVY